jgi:predicted kinase
MELVVFIGLQGSGKSTFYANRLASTHLRLNLDMLNTRHREGLVFDACIAGKTPTVIDNTNPTPEERARYIAPAKAAGFRVVGYYFQSKVSDCLARNATRDEPIPDRGILGTHKRLILPTRVEGFDQLWHVRIDNGDFVVSEWNDEL